MEKGTRRWNMENADRITEYGLQVGSPVRRLMSDERRESGE